MDSEPSPPKKRRHSKACTRCRKRKIRCDFQFPACGACSKAGEACLGFDPIHGVDKPRSTVSHLEQEVARLDTELTHAKSQTRSISDIANASVEKLSTRLCSATAGCSRKPESLPSLTSTYFLSGSSVPYLSSNLWYEGKSEQVQERPRSINTLSSIPRHIVDIMLKHYCEIYRPQYPAIEESDLYKACDRVYSNTRPSDFDLFCVHVILAISTNTLRSRDEKRALAAAYGFWTTAVAHLDQVGSANSWERLQALQLLAHYAFLNPKDVDCSKCTAAATRLCLQLGLHLEVPATERIKLDNATLETRRRLFWHSYSIDSAVHTVRCRPFMWLRSMFTAEFPDFDSPSPTAQVWLLRQIETEINLVMYYPLLGVEEPFPNGSFSQWFTLVHERLTQWVQTTRQSATLSDKLEFHELHFQMQLLRLNRPSPRCPNPDSAMRKKALKASIDLIKGFSLIDRLETLFYIWHGTYCIVEAGVCLLAAILTSMESASHDQAQTNLGGEDVGILIKYMKTFPCLVTKIASQWPDVAPHAVALDTVSRQSLESLQQWTRGEGTWRSDHEALKQKLNQFSQFSPLPSGPESPPTDDYTRSTVDGYPMVEQPAPETGFGDTSIPTGLQPSLQPGLMNSQSTLTQSNMGFPDPFSFDVGDAMAWDFSGLDSEEIFAALLENEPFPLGNIIT